MQKYSWPSVSESLFWFPLFLILFFSNSFVNTVKIYWTTLNPFPTRYSETSSQESVISPSHVSHRHQDKITTQFCQTFGFRGAVTHYTTAPKSLNISNIMKWFIEKNIHPQQQDLGNFLQFIFKAVSVVNYTFLLLDLLREQQNAKQLSLLVSYAYPRFKGALKPAGCFLCTLHSSA